MSHKCGYGKQIQNEQITGQILTVHCKNQETNKDKMQMKNMHISSFTICPM